MELPAKLMQLRKKKGWTQANAAQKISIQQSYLSKLESGRCQPSEEVISKLCSAYDIKPKELLSSVKTTSSLHYLAYLSAIIGLLLLLSGALALVFPDTYYTYKGQSLGDSSVKALHVIDFHVTDVYQGDSYIQSTSRRQIQYNLVTQREISRVENRWLIALGVFFFSLPILLFIYRIKVIRF